MQIVFAAGKADKIPPATVITIGMFDGVHLGHQALIQRTLALAAEKGFSALVLTFDRHADEVLRPDRARPYLMSLGEKTATIRALGVPLVAVAHVTPSFLAIPARTFVQRWLREELHMRALVVGPDFRFGHARQGDVGLLRALQGEFGYELEVLEPMLANCDPVSSTLIRRLLISGEVARASVLLGRPYRLSGEVVRGEQIGRTLGYPTANVAYPAHRILPALGVYLCRAEANGVEHGAAVNVGRRPTFEGTRITVEAYLFDFEGDLYGQTLSLDFLERLRAEQRFDGPEALRARIAEDVALARARYADGPAAVLTKAEAVEEVPPV